MGIVDMIIDVLRAEAITALYSAVSYEEGKNDND